MVNITAEKRHAGKDVVRIHIWVPPGWGKVFPRNPGYLRITIYNPSLAGYFYQFLRETLPSIGLSFEMHAVPSAGEGEMGGVEFDIKLPGRSALDVWRAQEAYRLIRMWLIAHAQLSPNALPANLYFQPALSRWKRARARGDIIMAEEFGGLAPEEIGPKRAWLMRGEIVPEYWSGEEE